MGSCQLCGKDTDEPVKTRIEGAIMKVCESCSDMGEKVEQKTEEKPRKKKKRKRVSSPRKTKVLANNYGEKVKEARESEKLSIKELADDLNEKASLLKKIEREEFKPDKSLAGKLEKKFGIDLYVNPEVSDHEIESGDDRKATLGDVAEVKE